MIYEGIEYVVRASLGRDQWTLMIYYSDNSRPTTFQFSGTRDEASAAARRRIDGWLTRHRESPV
jgi:hypothetical protein